MREERKKRESSQPTRTGIAKDLWSDQTTKEGFNWKVLRDLLLGEVRP